MNIQPETSYEELNNLILSLNTQQPKIINSVLIPIGVGTKLKL